MAEVLADLVGRLSFDADDKGVKQFARSVDTLAKASDDATALGTALGTFMGNLATKALDLAASLGKAAYAAGKDLVVGFAEGGAALDRMAKTTDLGVVALQRFQAAGRKAGLEPEATAKSIQVLNKNLADLALTGGGPAKDALGLLGVGLQELEGLDTEQRLAAIADALAGVPDAGERASLTMMLFGEEAGALAPILAKGSEGLDALGDAAERAGLVLDEKAVESAKRTKAALGDIDKTTTALENTISVALAPVVSDLAERFGEWYRANEEVIAQKLPEVIDAIVEGGGELIAWGQELARGLENLTGLFLDLGAEGEGAVGPLTDAIGTLVEMSRTGIETFVEWTDEVASMADLVWDVAGAVEDGLGAAWEYLEPVIDSVTQAIDEQIAKLGPVVDFVEDLVDRVVGLANRIGSLVDDVGLGKAFDAADREAITAAVDREAEPARAARQAAREEQAYQERVRKHSERLVNEAKDAEAAKARRKRGDKYRANLKASSGGTKAIDTEEAERLFGAEIDELARVSGATAKARRAAIEAAAKSLDGGAGNVVAREAAVGVLEGATKVDLSATGGIDAAMFGTLTRIGGPQAAQSAAAGARFVQVSNTWNFTQTFELQLPPGFGDGLQRDTAAVAGDLERMLTPVWERVIDRYGQGLEP